MTRDGGDLHDNFAPDWRVVLGALLSRNRPVKMCKLSSQFYKYFRNVELFCLKNLFGSGMYLQYWLGWGDDPAALVCPSQAGSWQAGPVGHGTVTHHT